MALRLYNTLTARVDEFQPLAGNEVRIYTCGPTVYDFAHIGNFRTFVFQDILRRYLKYRGFRVCQVMNLTDVDDKTIRDAREAGLPLRDFTSKYIEAFEIDRKLLGLEEPEFWVRATDHVADMIKLIEILTSKGYTYPSDGSIYFRVEKFADYGKLSKVDLSGIKAGARVEADEYEKVNVRDFVLWKAAKEGEPRWESPFGPGRPGWHIECSAMAMKYLGETLDIHSGGTDLAFPHHENEIAQSEAATGKPFARFWLHAEHLMVNGERMSKSLGNFYTLRKLIAAGHKPTAVRYHLASVHFRKPLNFTFEGLHQAQQSIERLRNFRSRLTSESFPRGESSELQATATQAHQAFERAMDENLNTAEALAAVFDLVRDTNTAMDQGRFHDGDRAAFLEVLQQWDRIFSVMDDTDYARLKEFGFLKTVESTVALQAGSDSRRESLIALDPEYRRAAEEHARYDAQLEKLSGQSHLGEEDLLQEVQLKKLKLRAKDRMEMLLRNAGGSDGEKGTVLMEVLADDQIEKQVQERNAARQDGNFARADAIRQELLKAGVILEDTKGGTRWKRK
jgi:cysteinyl-tRNA synthetase